MNDGEAPASPPAPAAGWVARLLASRKGLVVLYLAFLGAYLGASGARLRQHSLYNHFVYLADGWLHGRLALAGNPPNENDWAKVDVLKLHDGRELRGMFGRTGPIDRFYPLRGPSEEITPDEIASRTSIRYVSFPPFPAVVMAPFVAVWGLRFNDVLFTALWAAANPVLLFLLLRHLRRKGLSARSDVDDLWLTAAFGVGSVYYYCSVLGQVWYTAHVVATTLVIGYLWASLDAARPVLAGLCCGFGFATRTPLGFIFPLFVWEAVRVSGGVEGLRGVLRGKLPPGLLGRLVRFGLPAGAILVGVLVLNYARFERPTEFGHKFLNVLWLERIQKWGLFNYHFLSRNLSCALTLAPRVLTSWPYVKVSDYGMSLLITSPYLVYLAMSKVRTRLAAPLWLTIAAAALPTLLYQNSGYIQFGYRFSLDFMIFFIVLLAAGGRRVSWMWKGLIVAAFVVNLFGAITFDRWREFYYDDTFFPHGNN